MSRRRTRFLILSLGCALSVTIFYVRHSENSFEFHSNRESSTTEKNPSVATDDESREKSKDQSTQIAKRQREKEFIKRMFRASFAESMEEKHAMFAESGFPFSFDEIATFSQNRSGLDLFELLVEEWAKRDGPGLIRWAEKNIGEIDDLILDTWAKQDPGAALQFVIDELPITHPKRKYLIKILTEKKNPEILFDNIAQAPSEEERKKLIRQLSRSWPDNKLDELVNWIRSDAITQTERSTLLVDIIDRLSLLSPELAMELANSNPDLDLNDFTLANIITNLAKATPDQALPALNELDAAQRNAVIWQITKNLVEKNPEKAWDWAYSLDAKDFESASKSIIQNIKGAERMMLFEQLIEEPREVEIDNAILYNFTMQADQPEENAKLLEKFIATRKQQLGSGYGIVSKNTPSRDSVIEANEQDIFNQGITSTASRLSEQLMLKKSPIAALNWIETLPLRSEEDFVTFTKHPIQLWAMFDKENAREWIEFSTISNEGKATLTAALNKSLYE